LASSLLDGLTRRSLSAAVWLHASVTLAEWFSRLHEKALALEVLFAQLLLKSSDCVLFAKYSSRFRVKAFPLQVVFTHRAVEALRVVVVVESLHPAISSFDRKSARNAFRRKQLIPIFFTIGQAVFKVEWRIGEEFSAVRAIETLGMEGLRHRLQAILSFQFSQVSWHHR